MILDPYFEKPNDQNTGATPGLVLWWRNGRFGPNPDVMIVSPSSSALSLIFGLLNCGHEFLTPKPRDSMAIMRIKSASYLVMTIIVWWSLVLSFSASAGHGIWDGWVPPFESPGRPGAQVAGRSGSLVVAIEVDRPPGRKQCTVLYDSSGWYVRIIERIHVFLPRIGVGFQLNYFMDLYGYYSAKIALWWAELFLHVTLWQFRTWKLKKTHVFLNT